jgi:hypothetical protein
MKFASLCREPPAESMPIWPDGAEFHIRIREITTDVGDVERAKDRSVGLAFEQEAEALFE